MNIDLSGLPPFARPAARGAHLPHVRHAETQWADAEAPRQDAAPSSTPPCLPPFAEWAPRGFIRQPLQVALAVALSLFLLSGGCVREDARLPATPGDTPPAPGVALSSPDPDVRVVHDARRMVTCWIYSEWGTGSGAGGISCLPDWQLGSALPLPNLGTTPRAR